MFGDFLFYVVPWWAWLALALVVVAGLFLLAVRAFGWERVKSWVLPVLTVIGAGALLSRARQQGWQDKINRDLKAADQLIAKARKARDAENVRNQDPEKLREDDGFRRD